MNAALNDRLCSSNFIAFNNDDGREKSELGNVGRSIRDFKTTAQVIASGEGKVMREKQNSTTRQVSDKLFNVRDSDVVRNLAPTFDLLQRIVQSDELRQRSNKVQVVVLTLTRILAAIR